MDQANCRGMGLVQDSLFYPERSNTDVSNAKSICNGTGSLPPCAVKDQCLEYAIAHNEKHGVWGGTSERERRRLRRQAAARKAKRPKGKVA